MVFWDRRNDDELPPELRGKKPEDIAAALRASDDARKAAADAETARKAAEDKFAAQATEFEQMKARMVQLEANQRPPEAPPPPDEPASPWVDPQKFVQEETKRTTILALAAGVMAARITFTQGLSPRDQKIFRKYEGDVVKVVETFAPEQRVMPQSWQNAFLYIKGLHDVDISKAESTQTDFFSETPSRGNQPEPEPQDKLTPEEEEACRKFHFDPKTYLERKKAGVLAASEKGQYARYPVETTR